MSSLSLLLLPAFLVVSNALRCHQCSHENVHSATRKIHDRVESSPDFCAVRGECEGKWCVTSLNGTNVNFSCASRAPVDYLWEEEKIHSYCTATYNVDGVAHATCWCRTKDFCLSSGGETRRTAAGLISLGVLLVLLFR